MKAKRLSEMAYGFWPGAGHRPRRRDAPAVVEALRCCVWMCDKRSACLVMN